jgi:hypothetical protein
MTGWGHDRCHCCSRDFYSAEQRMTGSAEQQMTGEDDDGGRSPRAPSLASTRVLAATGPAVTRPSQRGRLMPEGPLSTGFVGRRRLIVLSAGGRRAEAADDGNGGGDLPAPRAEEDLLLDFVVYLCFVKNFAHSTICGYLCWWRAVRWVHLSHGFVDQLLEKPRLTLARRAVKRTRGPPKGKLPVSPDMLRNIHGHLELKRTSGPPKGKLPVSPDMLRTIHGHLELAGRGGPA